MKVLVAVEHKDGKLKKIARELIGASEKIGDVEVAVVGFQLSSVVEELKKYNIKKLYVAENKALKEYSSEVYTTILEKIVEDSKPQVVFFWRHIFWG